MGVTMTKWEGPIFTGDKEFNGSLAIDAEPGGEKVTNGSFTGNATGWTLGAQWAYGSNAVAKSGAGTSTLSQDVSAIANEIYKVVYTTSGISGGAITVSIGGVSGTARTTNATFTEYITATGTGALTFTPASATAVTIDDVSVKRVGVVAADRVTMWAGDRVASGVEAAGDAGLFVRSEDGTQHFLGDTSQIGGALLINATAAYADNGQLLEVNKSADDGGIGLFCWSATDAERALLEFHKSASATIGTKALVADEEAIGGIIWKAADGAANWQPTASIEGYVDTTPGAGDTGGRLVLSTTADGVATLTERVRIDNAGNVGIGATSFGSSAAKVLAIGSGTAPTTSPTDMVQLWSADTSGTAAKAGLHIRTEDGTSHVFGHLVGINKTVSIGATLDIVGNTPATYYNTRIVHSHAGTAWADVYPQLALGNTNSTTNNWSGITFDDSGPNSVAGIQVINTNHATHTADMTLWTNAGSGLVEAVRVSSDQSVRFLAGNVKIANATEGGTGTMNIKSARVLTAALSGATVNMAFQIPSGAMLLGAQFNVNTAITGATSWSAAFNTGSTTSLGSGYALSLDTKVNKLIIPEITTGLTDITLTAAGSNFTAGVIECVVFYIDTTAMANA